ncbi:polyprenol monophosphomannose synthase [Phototrophicus methaneseepsis]|uniref:Polyprenol monophosphomannose synthase n=1 Tax=Phototrophicus methaneseepsis TaxID=2710758 RepID=A0A7S8EC74_9CHLR|nr:polyprenol monophosphomannose synthase [Phototrophicus methaneseepsis]QPC84290.1 polyprenol monophosphomannose synthase [Phototrophicus methaneseepsis]
MQKIFVVSPTYNERDNLPRLAAGLFALDNPGLEILVVDDNSPDGTAEVAEELREKYDEKVHVLRRKGPRGFAASYFDGFRLAAKMGADLIVQMDADLSHMPRHLAEMLDMLNRGNYDVVIGSRYVSGGGVDVDWPWHRKFLSGFANQVYTPAILSIPIHDTTSGFRVWRTESLMDMDIDRVQSNGYVFGVEMIYAAYRMGYRIGESPIYFPDRQYGNSKMSSSIAIEAALRVWQILFRYRRLTPAMRKKRFAPPVSETGL